MSETTAVPGEPAEVPAEATPAAEPEYAPAEQGDDTAVDEHGDEPDTEA